MEFETIEKLVRHLIFRYEDVMKQAEAKGVSIWDKRAELNEIKSKLHSYFPPPLEAQIGNVTINDEGPIKEYDSIEKGEDEENDKSDSNSRGKRTPKRSSIN